MKNSFKVILVLTIILSAHKTIVAQETENNRLPENIVKFNSNVASFIENGDYNTIKDYITLDTKFITGKKQIKVSSESDEELIVNKFKESGKTKGVKYNAWTSDGKYYYMLIESRISNELSNFYSIFVEVTDEDNVIVKVWIKS